ncbi:unnamed protein product [Didymodactylos carnosus]|uniref:Uncharacterized protein n=1 Tax=Didymodactylos carnosus TaxID=1234261 RepID=A0A8S2FNA5_9BILA|nr:unnamed protein product [Didymodactylos carnosus]CAF4303399.1 unnamed protein product [Didymodactylos carnosus]
MINLENIEHNKCIKSFKQKIILKPYPSSFASSNSWSNKDLDPVPPQERSWSNPFYVIAYWISDAFTISTWSMASSMIALGLSWKAAFAAIVIGHSIIAIPMYVLFYIIKALH